MLMPPHYGPELKLSAAKAKAKAKEVVINTGMILIVIVTVNSNRRRCLVVRGRSTSRMMPIMMNYQHVVRFLLMLRVFCDCSATALRLICVYFDEQPV